MISEGGGQSLTEKDNNNNNIKMEQVTVSNQLHLKAYSNSDSTSSQGLDKNLVLRRIRHRRTLNKLKTALHSLLPSSQPVSIQQDEATQLLAIAIASQLQPLSNFVIYIYVCVRTCVSIYVVMIYACSMIRHEKFICRQEIVFLLCYSLKAELPATCDEICIYMLINCLE